MRSASSRDGSSSDPRVVAPVMVLPSSSQRSDTKGIKRRNRKRVRSAAHFDTFLHCRHDRRGVAQGLDGTPFGVVIAGNIQTVMNRVAHAERFEPPKGHIARILDVNNRPSQRSNRRGLVDLLKHVDNVRRAGVLGGMDVQGIAV